jgi:integrase
MPAVRLSKRTIDALTPRERTAIVYDRDLTGFGIRITPAGAKSYIVEYRPGAGGRRTAKRRLTLGSVGALTPDQARAEARRRLASVALGDDPARERAARRRACTMAELIERFLVDEVQPTRRASTAKLYAHYFEKHLVPALGATLADDLSHAQVTRLHRVVGASAPVTANRLVATLSGLFAWAGRQGEVKTGHNPAAGVVPFPERARERYLSSAELQRLGRAIEEAETIGIEWTPDPCKKSKHAPKNRRVRIGPHVAAALRLLALTGARLREILHLRWDQVDTARALAIIPVSKTGPKVLPLSSAALSVLEGLPRASDYVVAGADPARPRADLHRPWELVRARAGLEGVRLHDLRHSHASAAAACGLSLPIIGALLGHRQPSTTQRYVHLTGGPLHAASERVGTAISDPMSGVRSKA